VLCSFGPTVSDEHFPSGFHVSLARLFPKFVAPFAVVPGDVARPIVRRSDDIIDSIAKVKRNRPLNQHHLIIHEPKRPCLYSMRFNSNSTYCSKT